MHEYMSYMITMQMFGPLMEQQSHTRSSHKIQTQVISVWARYRSHP